jgi:hypothetical protein
MTRTKKAAIIVAAALAILGTPVLATILYVEYRYRTHPSTAFCRDALGLTEAQITRRATSAGLTVMPFKEPDTRVWIFRPEDGPMFRFACEVNIDTGKVVRAKVVDAD